MKSQNRKRKENMIDQPLDVLIVAPHPDDAELAMGGTIAKLIASGKRVGVVDLTRGETGSKGAPEIRAQEVEESTKILGLHCRKNLDMGDGRLQDTFEERLKVIDVIRECRAPILFTTVPFDRHPDHKAACQLVSHAFFQARQPKIETEHPAFSARRCFHYFIHDFENAGFAVDISDYMNVKLDAMKAFKSQFVNPELPEGYRHAGIQDYITQVESINRAMGVKVGVEYAEGFCSQGPVLIDNPTALE